MSTRRPSCKLTVTISNKIYLKAPIPCWIEKYVFLIKTKSKSFVKKFSFNSKNTSSISSSGAKKCGLFKYYYNSSRFQLCLKNCSQFIWSNSSNWSTFFQVNIPIVPILPKALEGEEVNQINRLNRSTSNPPISPHRINNFVYESSPNRLIFDFGQQASDPVKIVVLAIFVTSVTSVTRKKLPNFHKNCPKLILLEKW